MEDLGDDVPRCFCKFYIWIYLTSYSLPRLLFILESANSLQNILLVWRRAILCRADKALLRTLVQSKRVFLLTAMVSSSITVFIYWSILLVIVIISRTLYQNSGSRVGAHCTSGDPHLFVRERSLLPVSYLLLVIVNVAGSYLLFPNSIYLGLSRLSTSYFFTYIQSKPKPKTLQNPIYS
jgi:hypothetical protein